MLHSENSAEIENKGTISAELTYIVRQKEKPYFESSHSTGVSPKYFLKQKKEMQALVTCVLTFLHFQLIATGLN